MVRFLTILVFVAAAAGVGGWAYLEYGNASANTADSVPRVPVTKGDLTRTVDSIGEVKAARSSLINAPFSGKVVKMLEEGVRVSEGDVIIWMETDEKEEQLKDQQNELGLAEKDLAAAQEEYQLQEQQNEFSMRAEEARVEIAEQRYKDSQQKFEAERKLVEKSISPQSRLDEAELAMLQSGVELRNARINLQKTQENLASNLRIKQTAIDKQKMSLERTQQRIKELEDEIEQAKIKSPTDGELSYLKVWKNGTSAKIAEGDSVWPRLSLVEIPDRSQMMAVVPVNELDISQVEMGQEVEVRLEALPEESFAGVVEKKSIVPISNQNHRWDSGEGDGGPREFEVQIKLLEADEMFRQGMTSSVSIIVEKKEDVLMVPMEALTMHEQQVGVWRENGLEPHFVPLNVLLTNDVYAAVEGDLQDGQMVYLRDPSVEGEDARDLARQALLLIREQENKNKSRGSEGAPVGEEPRQFSAAGTGA